MSVCSYFLLLHQFGVWTVVDHVRAKDGRCQLAVDFFRVDILELSIQDEFISFVSKIDCDLLAE
jgi:hypothetical protein